MRCATHGERDNGDKHGRSVTVFLRSPTGNLKTQNLTNLHRDRKTRLPSGGDLPLVLSAVVDTESLGESLVGVKLTEQKSVVTFHDNGAS